MTQTAYDSILSKARKVAELAERGIAGEAEAAKNRLKVLMEKYGLTLDDLSQETIHTYKFRINSQEEHSLLSHIVYTVCQTLQVANGTYSNRPGYRWYELTPYQFVEISEMYAFHVKQLRKELKALKDSIVGAYVNKHKIFPPNHKNNPDNIASEDDSRKVFQLMNLLDDNVKYRKALNK